MILPFPSWPGSNSYTTHHSSSPLLTGSLEPEYRPPCSSVCPGFLFKKSVHLLHPSYCPNITIKVTVLISLSTIFAKGHYVPKVCGSLFFWSRGVPLKDFFCSMFWSSLSVFIWNIWSRPTICTKIRKISSYISSLQALYLLYIFRHPRPPEMHIAIDS